MWQSWLSAEQSAAVDELASRAAAVDGFDPLNEEARLARASGQGRHLLALDGEQPVGYLFHSPEHHTAQLVVDPAHRRRRIGSRLASVLAQDSPLRLWAFRDAPAAQGFARHHVLVEGRALLVMAEQLSADAVHEPGDSGSWRALSTRTALPARYALGDGVSLRGYQLDDAPELLRVNAAAFAHHPEQGTLDAAGLAARMAENWFDPEGLIVAVDDSGNLGSGNGSPATGHPHGNRLLGFHWTKRVGDVGEVYVIGVDPSAQGRGLGKRLLEAGLEHLAEAGCHSVILYVDSADTVAVGMYEAAGFGVAHRDVLYVPATEERQ